MESREKTASYASENTYTTLNTLSDDTENVWVVFHGIGYLSRYFVPFFRELDPRKNYIVAPQAPSKYYLDDGYRNIGASWLTREGLDREITNVLNYVGAVFEREQIPDRCKRIVFGFSQGVSIACRWVALRQVRCDQLVLYAGGLPGELSAEHFQFLRGRTEVTVITGDDDPYLNAARMEQENHKIQRLFGDGVRRLSFEGGHEMKKAIIAQLV